MASEHVERKLAAILAADIAGYSRLTGADEEGTIRRIAALRAELIDPAIQGNRGRIVKTTGDGMLIEFASVVDAVRCSLDVQRGMAVRNGDFVPEKRIEFRIGIHLGDVMVQPDGDLLGDGVNIAARLEGIAAPGGLCLSSAAYEQVRDKIKEPFTDLGEHSLKNIARPVRVYATEIGNSRLAATARAPKTRPEAGFRRPALAIAFALALLAIAGGAWRFYGGGTGPPAPARAPAEAKRFSIVVLPFSNLSGDVGQDYVGDVLTEELTTSLSRLPGSFVVSRTTAFTYRGKTVDVKQIGKDLDIRYVLEGSAQKSGTRLRVSAQLIDAASGAHLWADQIDADNADMMQMQDQIVTRIARTLQIELTAIEAARTVRAHPDNPDADELAMQCEAAWLRYGPARLEMQPAYALCERALSMDSRNARALTILAGRIGYGLGTYQSTDAASELRQETELIERALAADPNYYLAHQVKGNLLSYQRPDESIAEAERALALNPSFVPAYLTLSVASWNAGRLEKSLDYAETSLRLGPRDPSRGFALHMRALLHFTAARYEDANDACRRTIATFPSYPLPHAIFAASLALSGHEAEAREALQRYLAQPLAKTKTIAQWKAAQLYEGQTARDYFARVLQGLRIAGMPEE